MNIKIIICILIGLSCIIAGIVILERELKKKDDKKQSILVWSYILIGFGFILGVLVPVGVLTGLASFFTLL